MGLWQSLGGMVEAELTSADLEAALGAVSGKNIPLHRIRKISDLSAEFFLSRKDYPTLCALAAGRGDSLKLVSRLGVYWKMQALLRRPVLLFGMAFLLILVLFLPTRVLFIRVEGNETVPANRILEVAERSGICFGASRRDVRSEKMKNAMLGAVPELQWAGVNTAGCVATISVRERTAVENRQEPAGITNIAAIRDGVVTSCTVTGGTALCTVGQAVRRGQILVSGYTDCGICIRAEQSQGEIFAQTNREITAVTPANCLAVTENVAVMRKYSLIFRKKRINLWKDSGISDAGCGRIDREYYLTLPGGFSLPLGLATETYTLRETAEREIPIADAEAELAAFGETYLTGQMVAGQILRKQENVTAQSGLYLFSGEYDCTEMIGRVQREQIGEYHE